MFNSLYKKDKNESPAASNVDYARGEAFLTDSSSGEESSEDEDGEGQGLMFSKKLKTIL